MRIFYTSDIHVNPDHLHVMVETAIARHVDAVIIGGDVVPHYLPGAGDADILAAQADYLDSEMLPALRKLTGRQIRIFLDLGNDDFAANRHILENCGDRFIRLLHRQQHALSNRIDLVGYMSVPPTPFYRKDWEKPDTIEKPYCPENAIRLDGYITRSGTEQAVILDIHSKDTIAADMAELSKRIEKPFIFISHCPPYNTPLDVLYNGNHAGSLAIRSFIEQWSAQGKLLASCHGHIHESPSRSGHYLTHINGAICINPGQGDTLHYVILHLESDTEIVRIERSEPWAG